MTKYPGFGVMFHHLAGGSQQNANKYYGRIISSVSMDEEKLIMSFSDGVTIKIFDDGQSCCEHRYMKTDDDLQTLVGNELHRIEAKDGNNIGDDEYGEHEVCFVEIGTDKGFVTISNHNEHNGYYGGFGLTIEENK